MSRTSRREFLSQTVLAAAAATVSLSPLEQALASVMQRETPRSYTAGRFYLEIGGQPAANLEAFSGGEMIEGSGATEIRNPGTRQLGGGVRWSDMVVKCGAAISPVVHDWIQTALENRPAVQKGALVAADFNYKAQSRLDFSGFLAAIDFPACDAASRQPVTMSFTIRPEEVRWSKAGGEDIRGKVGPKQKAWLADAFRLQITGMDCSRVSRIEHLGAKLVALPNQTRMQPSDLVITLPAQDAERWKQLSAERTKALEGVLTYFAPNLQEPLFTIMMRGLSLARPAAPAGGGQFQIELSCDSLALA